MKKILVAFVCVVIIGVSWRMVREAVFGVPRDAPIFGSPASDSGGSQLQQRLAKPPAPPVSDELGPPPKPWPWQEKYTRATDLFAFVREALPEAEGGNGDAQFAIYDVFRACRDGLAAGVQQAHTYCDGLMKQYPDYARQADLWLVKSSQAGFPRGLIHSSLEDLRLMIHKPPGKKERQVRLAAARSNVMQALKSNDPYVTGLVPNFLWLFFPDDPRVEQAEWVWKLGACEQGLDCQPDSSFVLEDCRRRNLCMRGESGQAYVRRVAAEIPSLDSRARKLAKLLREGAIDDKSFDETVTTLEPPKSDLFAKSRAPKQAR